MEFTKWFGTSSIYALTPGCSFSQSVCVVFISFMLNQSTVNANVDIWYADLPGSEIIRYIGPPPSDKNAFDEICNEYWSGNGITDHDVWYGPDGPGNHSLCISPTGWGNKWMQSRPTGLVCTAEESINSASGACGCRAGKVLKNGQCITPPSDCTIGNPCDPASGNKSQTEVDYAANGAGVELVRTYNSSADENVGFGVGWASTFHKKFILDNDRLVVLRGDGRGDPWVKIDGLWSADPDSPFHLTEHANGFTLALGTGDSEHYDYAGKIQSETRASGQTIHYAYDANGRLIAVTGPFGHAFSLAYDGNDRIVSVTDPGNHNYLYSYDSNNNLTSIEYPDNSVRLYHYEDVELRNHLTGITDENGDRFATYVYDSKGRAISSARGPTNDGPQQGRFLFDYSAAPTTVVTDPAGQLWDYSYEQNLGIFKLINRVNQWDGRGIAQQFDVNNNLVSYTDEEGYTTTHAYNDANQRIRTIEAEGAAQSRTVSFEYLSTDLDLATRVATPSVFSGATREVLTTYDSNLNVAATTTRGFDPGGDPVSRISKLQYNASGQVVEIDGPRTDVSDRTFITYYECNSGRECGQVASITDAAGHTTTFDSYDADGHPTQSTDPLGVITKWTYDARERITSIVQIPAEENGAARTTSFNYDDVGQLIAMSNPGGKELTYVYDSAHNLRSVSDSLGNIVEYAYDLKGNRIQEITKDPDGIPTRSVHTAYDLRDRIGSIDRGGSITRMLHNAVGNLVSVTDPNRNPATVHHYDALRRLVHTLDELSNSTTYQYDVRDNLIQVAAPNSAQTTYEYDDLGNLLAEKGPDRGTMLYTHDAAGNIIFMVDARGVSAAYIYDALNRVTNIDYPGTDQDQIFVYDNCKNGVRRLCQVTDQSGTTSFEYDSFGNIAAHLKDEDGNSYLTRYSYDDADRIIQISYPHGGTVTYLRDAVGRTTDVDFEINGVTLPILQQRTYRADGLVTSQLLGNGLMDVRRYDLQGRLLSQDLGTEDSRSYQFDASGNMLLRSQNTSGDPDILNVAYVYDALDRIVEETGTEGGLEFTYDANGNRLTRTKDGISRGYEIEMAANRLSEANDKGVVLDAAGNTLSDRNGKRSFSYNVSGRLSKVYKDGAVKATYLYNAHGLRTKKIKETSNGQKTFIYHYDLNGNLVAETKSSKALRYYIWVDAQPVAQLRLKQTSRGEVTVKHVTYITTDHLQSPRLGTNDNQNIVWRWDGDSFGQSKADRDPDADDSNRNIRLRFPGQFYDAESGLHYNWFRYYDPKIGRYITSDPIGLRGGLNTYLYARANPIRFEDPLGLESSLDWDLPSGSNHCTLAPDRPFFFNFASCCQSHDICYGTCGASRSACDYEFCSCLSLSCAKNGMGQNLCKRLADLYCLTVSGRGQPWYDRSQTVCNRCVN